MFQQSFTCQMSMSSCIRTNKWQTTLSDALAAQVGGLRIAPGANIGDGFALFETTHGTAPNICGRDYK